MTEESSRIDFADVGGEPLLPPLRRHRRRQHRRLDWSPHPQGRKWTRPNSMHIYFTMGPELIWIRISHCCRCSATVADNTNDWTDPPQPGAPLRVVSSLVQIQCKFILQWGRSWYEFALTTALVRPWRHHHLQLDQTPHPQGRKWTRPNSMCTFITQWGRLI